MFHAFKKASSLITRRSRDTVHCTVYSVQPLFPCCGLVYAIRGGMVSDDILVNRDREGDGLKRGEEMVWLWRVGER